MIRKNWPLIVMSLIVVMLLLGYIMRGNLYNFISKKMQDSAGNELILSGEKWVESSFNYKKNKKDFQFTLLEFKSTGCTICKSMESELDNISNSQDKKVNVVILNIMNPNSQDKMKYFGISAVPIHILLNNEGKELFRNYGFISAEEILAKL